eukprot:3310856-Alexandrium_andersonii.AAC.1
MPAVPGPQVPAPTTRKLFGQAVEYAGVCRDRVQAAEKKIVSMQEKIDKAKQEAEDLKKQADTAEKVRLKLFQKLKAEEEGEADEDISSAAASETPVQSAVKGLSEALEALTKTQDTGGLGVPNDSPIVGILKQALSTLGNATAQLQGAKRDDAGGPQDTPAKRQCTAREAS